MKRLMFSTAVAVGLSLTLAPAAHAQEGGQQLQADLTEQNGSGARAVATVTVNGTDMTVEIEGSGFTPGESPHAQHIHGVIGGENTCPTAAEDADGDGFVNTTEGAVRYGPILVSLTTEGGMAPDADALAVDRMPVADANGNLTYSRTFAVGADVADNIDALHIVQHGVDFDGSGAYDGDRMSDLDPSLPAEATDPADCGELVAMPAGGVQTGGGALAAHDHATQSSAFDGTVIAIAVGAAAVATAGGIALRRRAA